MYKFTIIAVFLQGLGKKFTGGAIKDDGGIPGRPGAGRPGILKTILNSR
jgi:hypothetical protein